MLKKFIGMGISAVILASTFGLAATGAAQAESTMRVCGEQWKAAKAAGTTGGKTWNEFLTQCSADQKTAAPAADSTAAPIATAQAAPAAQEPAAEAAPAKPKRKVTALAAGPGQFATDAEAKAKCPSDTIVWVNSKSKVFHYSSSSAYGKTKKGVYMCEADATSAGAHAAKNEKKS
jgi:hypothetical protein